MIFSKQPVEPEYILGHRINPHTTFAKGGGIYRRLVVVGGLLLCAVLALLLPLTICLSLHQWLGDLFCRPVPRNMDPPERDMDEK